jgi:hypothetical protein
VAISWRPRAISWESRAIRADLDLSEIATSAASMADAMPSG